MIKPEAIGRIAVIAPNKPYWGANLVQLPFLGALRRAFPRARLTVFAPVPDARLFAALGVADAVEVYDRSRPWPLLAGLRRARPDLVLSLRDRSVQTNLAAFLSGTRRSAGYASPLNRLLLRRTVLLDDGKYIPLRYLDLLDALGIAHRGLDEFAALFPPERLDLPPDRTPIVFMPGGGQPQKKWGIANFLALAAALRRTLPGALFLFVLGDAEREDIPAIEAALAPQDRRLLVNEAPAVLIDAVRRSRVTVANDCGPSHIAQMCGVPYVGLFGVFDAHTERRIGEWFHRHGRSRVLTPAAGEPITALPVQAVLAAAAAVAGGES